MAFTRRSGYTRPSGNSPVTAIAVNKRSDIKAAVTAAFSAAVDTYERRAEAQRDIATALAQRIEALALPTGARILEIGCGTGFLTRHLIALNARELVVSDISSAMVESCRASLPHAVAAKFVVMDGEDAGAAGDGFDLVCSSLAFQWFGDLRAGLRRLSAQVAPGGYIVFSTLAADTFQEWRHAHTALSLEPALRSYPTVAALIDMLPSGAAVDVREDYHRRRYADGQAFIAELKQIGAHLPEDTSRALNPGALRRVLRSVEGGIDATYHVASVVWQKA